jgi:HlyD family secretion protein
MKFHLSFPCKQYNVQLREPVDGNKLKFNKWRWPALLIIGVLALSTYWLTQLWLGPQVVGLSVRREELIQTVVANGKVELPEPVEIVSKSNGNISAVNAKAGQSVSAGQILLTLASKNDRGIIERAKVATALAEARFKKVSELTHAGSEQSLSRAKFSVESAKKQYARSRELAAKGFVSQEQASDALRNLTISQSQLATAQFQAKANRAKGSDYALAELALNKARAYERALRDKSGSSLIKAATDGLLTSCHVAAGDKVMPGKKLMVISPTGTAHLVLQLDENNRRDLKLGQQARIVAEGHSEQSFGAVISSISPAADTAQGKFAVKLDSLQSPEFLRQDMVVSAEIEVTRRADALLLPLAAVRDGDSAEPWVMVLDNGRAQRRRVKLGVRDKARVEVLDGLHENELVFPATGFAVPEGQRIRLARS